MFDNFSISSNFDKDKFLKYIGSSIDKNNRFPKLSHLREIPSLNSKRKSVNNNVKFYEINNTSAYDIKNMGSKKPTKNKIESHRDTYYDYSDRGSISINKGNHRCMNKLINDRIKNITDLQFKDSLLPTHKLEHTNSFTTKRGRKRYLSENKNIYPNQFMFRKYKLKMNCNKINNSQNTNISLNNIYSQRENNKVSSKEPNERNISNFNYVNNKILYSSNYFSNKNKPLIKKIIPQSKINKISVINKLQTECEKSTSYNNINLTKDIRSKISSKHDKNIKRSLFLNNYQNQMSQSNHNKRWYNQKLNYSIHDMNIENNLSINNNLCVNTNCYYESSPNRNINLSSIKQGYGEEYFECGDDKDIELTKEEHLIYGDRFMRNMTKIKLLGKGGCGIVWLAKSNKYTIDDNKKYLAVKQTSKKGNNNIVFNEDNLIIARNEIIILKLLNEDNDNQCDLIPKLYEYYEDNNDIWLSFEKGGHSISNLSFKIKGEFEKGERIYYIQKGIFLIELFANIKQFKYLIKKLLEGIYYINSKGIVHSDIKPENILVEYILDEEEDEENRFKITNVKIIDYGSAFIGINTNSITSNTPEYLCPEITCGNKKFLKDLNESEKYINSIDIWSLGITILELCLCCPIWMSYKSKIILNSKAYYTSGIFGCRGRDNKKIYNKQVYLCKNLNKILNHSMFYMLNNEDKTNLKDLLTKMLNLDYKKRINAKDALNHCFLN